MNRIKFLIALALSAVLAASCEKNDMTEPAEELLEVNVTNISGEWKLVEWNGAALAEGTYVDIDIERDGTYTMKQNVDSFQNVPHTVTGRYALTVDVEAVIRGSYDHDSGDWAHRYVITKLTKSRMLWTAVDDSSFTQLFERVD